MARAFEYEYFGDRISDCKGGKFETYTNYRAGQDGNVGYINRTFRQPYGTPIRLGYVGENGTDLFQEGGSLRYLDPPVIYPTSKLPVYPKVGHIK